MQLDLSKLSPPDVIQERSFEAIRDEMLADFQARNPDYTAIVPSDPAYKLVLVAAYREMGLRQQFNERARGLLLAFSQGSDLDHIGVTYHRTERLVVDEGDPDANPPVPPTYETDEAYLERILLALPAFSTAGARAAYVYHARTASGQVRDASCITPGDAEVLVTVLSQMGDGTPGAELLDTVEAALNVEDIRPLTDKVTVQAAAVATYQVAAHLYIDEGADADVVREDALERLGEWVDRQHMLGRTIYRDAVVAQLYVEGVRFVELTAPVQDLERDDTQAAFCEDIDLEVSIYE